MPPPIESRYEDPSPPKAATSAWTLNAPIPLFALLLSFLVMLMILIALIVVAAVFSPGKPTSNDTVVVAVPALASASGIKKECQLRDIKVTRVKNATGNTTNLSIEQIRLQIGTPAFKHPSNRHWSCIDGRHENEVLMTAGGDAAEFITALAAYISYSATPQDFSPERVRAMWHPLLLQSYNAVRRFYMHTDEHAVERMGATLNITELDIIKPKPADYMKLLEMVALPNYLGCGHLRLMAQNPDVYKVPSALFANFLRLYHRTLWGMDGADLQGRLRMDVLPGDHDENAIVVMNEKGCLGFALVIASRQDMPHIFVTEVDAVVTLRQDFLAFFQAAEKSGSTVSSTLLEALNANAAVQLSVTATALAPQLPVFSVMMEGTLVADGD